MASLIVEVSKIKEVLPHPKADRLEIAVVKGWNVIIKKDEYKAGDKAVFIPPDYVVPKEVSDKFGFTQYLRDGRVRSTKLRGHPSHGVLVKPEQPWKEGTDVAAHYGITKYVAPFNPQRTGRCGGDQDKPHFLFTKYTEIENLRHFTDAFVDGEEVVVTEKIHGTNSRVGIVDGVMMAGSKNHRRKMPIKEVQDNWFVELLRKIKVWRKPRKTEPDYDRWNIDWYWSPIHSYHVGETLKHLYDADENNKSVIFYGETFGANVQKGVSYGTPDTIDYRCFDMKINGTYVDYDDMIAHAKWMGVPLVPELYRGPYSLDKIKELSQGKTVVNTKTDKANGRKLQVKSAHIREGVVVRPVKERNDPKVGRVILKYVSDAYLLAKDSGDFGDEDDTGE